MRVSGLISFFGSVLATRLQFPYDEFFDDDFTNTVRFGEDVTISGNYAAVSHGDAPFIFIFFRHGTIWTYMTAIEFENTGEAGITSLDMVKSVIAVGLEDENFGLGYPGVVHILSRSSTTQQWTETQQLSPAEDDDDGFIDEDFGSSVALDDDYLVVGAPYEQGAVYVYKMTNGMYVEVEYWSNPNGDEDDEFGTAVAIDGDWIAASAIGFDISGDESTYWDIGIVYTFKNNGGDWSLHSSILHPYYYSNNEFGNSLSISPNYLAVGIEDSRDAVLYKYEFGSWSDFGDVLHSLYDADDFGDQVQVYGDWLFVSDSDGSLYDDDNFRDHGSVSVYKIDPDEGPIIHQVIGPPDFEEESEFGLSMDFDGKNLIVGGYADGDDDGAAYVYELNNDYWALSCPAGSYIPNNLFDSDCQTCGTGKYQAKSGQYSCLDCMAGKYNINTGSIVSSACKNCGVGKYQEDDGQDSCMDCGTGTYNPSVGKTSSEDCMSCGKGTYNAGTGVAKCTNCVAGKYQDAAGQTSCTGCAAGKYSTKVKSMSEANCKTCAKGKYTANTGQTSCTNCDAGTYLTTTGGDSSSDCISCSAGKYSTTVGAYLASTCLSCPAAKYSAAQGASSSSTCQWCEAGTYNSLTGQSSCTNCGVGKYQSMTGMTSCTVCPMATYNPNTGSSSSSACMECAEGKYNSMTGQSSCTSCASGDSLAGSDSASDCIVCPDGYTYIAGSCYRTAEVTVNTKRFTFDTAQFKCGELDGFLAQFADLDELIEVSDVVSAEGWTTEDGAFWVGGMNMGEETQWVGGGSLTGSEINSDLWYTGQPDWNGDCVTGLFSTVTGDGESEEEMIGLHHAVCTEKKFALCKNEGV